MIRKNLGLVESFEREYFDLIRSAFLKYQFQARIGNMDGVFVAYHNTARMFGFQYVPLEEMDERLFGSAPGAGDRVFQKCMETLELVSDEIIACFPRQVRAASNPYSRRRLIHVQSVKCTFETQDGMGKDLNIWVEPLNWQPEFMKSEFEQAKARQTPIKQIVVTAKSFCGNVPAKGARCVGTMDQPCEYGLIDSMFTTNCTPLSGTVHWTITHRSSDSDKEDEIRASLQAAKDRRFRAYSLPTGISPQNIRDWWDALDFSGSKKINVPITPVDDEGNEGIEVGLSNVPTKKTTDESFFRDNFTPPDSRIQYLRDLANSGREETIRIGLEDRGRRKVVLGVGEIDWEDTLAEQEISAQIQRKEATAEAATERAEGGTHGLAQTQVVGTQNVVDVGPK